MWGFLNGRISSRRWRSNLCRVSYTFSASKFKKLTKRTWYNKYTVYTVYRKHLSCHKYVKHRHFLKIKDDCNFDVMLFRNSLGVMFDLFAPWFIISHWAFVCLTNWGSRKGRSSRRRRAKAKAKAEKAEALCRSSMCWEWKSLRSCEGDKRSRLGWRGELLMFGYQRFWRCLKVSNYSTIYCTNPSSFFIIFHHSYFIIFCHICSYKTSYLRCLREVLDTPEPESTTAATPSAQEVGFCLKSLRTCVVFFYIKLPSKYKGELDMVFESETKINTHTVGYLSCSTILDFLEHMSTCHCLTM